MGASFQGLHNEDKGNGRGVFAIDPLHLSVLSLISDFKALCLGPGNLGRACTVHRHGEQGGLIFRELTGIEFCRNRHLVRGQTGGVYDEPKDQENGQANCRSEIFFAFFVSLISGSPKILQAVSHYQFLLLCSSFWPPCGINRSSPSSPLRASSSLLASSTVIFPCLRR